MIDRQQACTEAILQAARQMCLAAQTAPKACGRDSVVSAVLTGEELARLARRMEAVEEEHPGCTPIFRRDAELVEKSAAVVLIGTLNQSRGLSPCGLCGHGSCAGMEAAGCRCAFDDVDLGIAVGSAVSVAADLRVDNRVMYSAGIAAMELGLLGPDVGTILAIPLAWAPRSIFFTRTEKVFCQPGES